MTNAPHSVVETLLLSGDDIRAVFDWPSAIEALRDAYAIAQAPESAPPRATARTKDGWLRTMTGVAPQLHLMGSKHIAVNLGLHRASYLISLFDTRTAELRALVDGNVVTGLRTAATSALAIDVLTPRTPLRVAVIGSGFEATHHVEALTAIRTVADLRVYSPTPAKRNVFAERYRQPGRVSEAFTTAAEAVRDVDLIICAARSRNEEPTLMASWLTRDAIIVSIGSTIPEQREIASDIVDRASLIVADAVDEVAHETGDMLAAQRAGISWDGKLVSLADLVAGHIEKKRLTGTVLYKSVGAALQDLTVAGMCFERAAASGTGTLLANAVVPAQK